jgi:hypothetical protein
MATIHWSLCCVCQWVWVCASAMPMALLFKSINYIQSYALTIESVCESALESLTTERFCSASNREHRERDQNNFNNKDIRESAFTPFRSVLPNTRPLFQWLSLYCGKLIAQKRDLWLYKNYINLKNFWNYWVCALFLLSLNPKINFSFSYYEFYFYFFFYNLSSIFTIS